MATSIAENLKKMDALGLRLDDVLKQYTRLEKQQQASSVQIRRDLSLPFPRERFYLAAILEHRLITLAFSARDDVSMTKEEHVSNGTIEIRPVWPGYYNELIECEQSRTAWLKAGVPDKGIPILENLVKTAESKVKDVTMAIECVTACTIKSTRSLSTILQTWTNFCLALYPDKTVDQAFAAIDLHAFHATPMSTFTGPGKRKWFIFNQFVGGILSNDDRPMSHFPHGTASELNPNAHSFQPQTSRKAGPQGQAQSPIKSAGPTRFQRYNDHWTQLDPKTQVFYLPSYDFQLSGLRDAKHTTYSPIKAQHWSEHTIMTTNAKVFFCKGFDVPFIINEDPNGKVTFSLAATQVDNITRLQRHLKLVETARWHPDKMNARTGKSRGIDQDLGSRDFVVAIRGAVQELVEECSKVQQ